MNAETLHTLRTEARRAVDDGRFEDAIRRYVEAADVGDQLQIPLEAELLRSRARQVVVLVWARAHGHDVAFSDIQPVYAPGRGMVVGPVRRFVVTTAQGDELVAIIDAADRVRLAPRRRS